jgi:hypothetical protein
MPDAAIEWYERAIQRNAKSVAIYNNLGASYLVGMAGLSRRDRLTRSEDNLTKALALDQASLTVQHNLMRLSRQKYLLDHTEDPSVAWPYARAVLAAGPNDALVRIDVAQWYRSVLEYEAKKDASNSGPSQTSSPLDGAYRIEFARVAAELPAPAPESESPRDPLRREIKVTALSFARYYLAPEVVETPSRD